MPPGSVTMVPHGRAGIGVYNIRGRFYAVNNLCPHRGAPLCLGSLTGTVTAPGGPGQEGERFALSPSQDGEFIECPWHGWRWEVATGKAEAYPDQRVRTFPVRVEDGKVIVEV